MAKRHRADIDGGWAWPVMVGALLGMTIYASALFMGGVLYTALLTKYKEGVAKTSLVGSLSYGCLCFLAPLAGIVMNKFSCRVSIISGGALSSAGFAVSAYAPSLNWIIVTAGVIAGAGFALSSAGLVCVLGFYFQKWRDQMISIAFIFLGVAMFISAPLGNYLLETHGIVATFLIVAAIQAQMCIIGVVCKPSVLEKEVHTRRKIVRKQNKEDKLSQYLDVTLLKNLPFLCFLLSTSAWNFALCVALMHLPNYLTVLGGTDVQINILMTSFSIANVIGRVIGLLVVSKLKERSLTVDVTVLFLTGLITTLFPYYAHVYGGTYIFSLQLGVFCGIPNSIMTPMAVKFVGLSKLSEAYGLSFLFCGFGVSTGPFVAAYIYGGTGSYDNSFLVAGVVLLVGGVFCLVARCVQPPEETEQKKAFEIKVDTDLEEETYLNGKNNNGLGKTKLIISCKGDKAQYTKVDKGAQTKACLKGKVLNGVVLTKSLANGIGGQETFMNGNGGPVTLVNEKCAPGTFMNGKCGPETFMNGTCGTEMILNGKCGPETLINGKCGPATLMNGKCGPETYMNGKCGPEMVMNGNCGLEKFMNGDYYSKISMNCHNDAKTFINGNCMTDGLLPANHDIDSPANYMYSSEPEEHGTYIITSAMNDKLETKMLLNGNYLKDKVCVDVV